LKNDGAEKPYFPFEKWSLFKGELLNYFGGGFPETSDTQISVGLKLIDVNPRLSHSQLVDLIQAKASINKSLS